MSTGLSLKAHPMSFLRTWLESQGASTAHAIQQAVPCNGCDGRDGRDERGRGARVAGVLGVMGTAESLQEEAARRGGQWVCNPLKAPDG
jgi:hypothetical protein